MWRIFGGLGLAIDNTDLLSMEIVSYVYMDIHTEKFAYLLFYLVQCEDESSAL